jgi:hypothetical protein
MFTQAIPTLAIAKSKHHKAQNIIKPISLVPEC